MLLLGAGFARAQSPGPPGGLVLGTEVLSQSGTELFLPAGFGARQVGWLLDFEQASARAGTFTLDLDSATDGASWRSGNNQAAWRNAPLGSAQADLFAGTLNLPSDLLDQHFANLYSPNLILSGGEFALRSECGWRLVAFGGRNLISQGPYIPFFTSAPDFVWGASLRPPVWHGWQFEARYLHTRAGGGSAPPLDGALNAIPAASNEIYLNADWRLNGSSQWLNEIALSRADRGPLASGGSNLSFTTGPLLTRPKYDLQAYALRQSGDYFPISNEVVGDREGGYAAGDWRPSARWSFSGSSADLRDNVAGSVDQPTLDAMTASAAGTFSPGAGYALTGSASRTDISVLAGGTGAANLTTLQIEGSRSYGENLTQLRWQDWITRSAPGSGPASAIQTEELDQQRNFGASFLSAGMGLQEGDNSGAGGALKMHLDLAANVAIGQRLTLFASGQIGRDLRDQSALSLTTLRTWVAEVQLHLPGQFELSAQFVRNAVVARLNSERLLLAGLAGGPVLLLPGNTQQVVFVRLTKSFRWGARVPLFSHGGEGVPMAMIPSYRTVAGVVFDDRAHTGQRAPGDEGIAGVVVRLDGAVATTDARGRFQFNGVRTGHYTLEIDVDHLPVRFTAPRETEMPVEVGARGTPPIQIPLQLVGSVSGQLRSEATADEPAPDVSGVALRLEPGNQLAFTQANGRFRFDNVPPGSYRVAVLPDTLPPTTELAGSATAPVEVASGANVAGLHFILRSNAPPLAVSTVIAPVEQISLPPPASRVAPPTAPPAAPRAAPKPLPPLPRHCRPTRKRAIRHRVRRRCRAPRSAVRRPWRARRRPIPPCPPTD